MTGLIKVRFGESYIVRADRNFDFDAAVTSCYLHGKKDKQVVQQSKAELKRFPVSRQ
jgi:hypothetical protein